MTTINMKDYVNGTQENMNSVNETINTIVPIIGKKNRTETEKSNDISKLEGILSEAIGYGKTKVLIKIPVELLAIDTAYQTPERTERSLSKLINKWNDIKLMPLLGVPHFEDGYIVLMDGYGRTVASQKLDPRSSNYKEYKTLEVMVILNAPNDPRERQKFEAEQYVYQNDGSTGMKPTHKHGGLEILEDEGVLLFDTLQKDYGFEYSTLKGNRGEQKLGSYTETLNLCSNKDYGEDCVRYILDICKESKFNRLANGYSTYIFRAFRDAWKYYPSDRVKTKEFLSIYLKGKTPLLIKAEAITKYKYLDMKSAVSFYVEDLLVKNLNLQQTRKLTSNDTKLEVIRKFA